jgi:hypothetical protein
MAMAQKSMPVQTVWCRWLIGIGTPLGVKMHVDDRGVMRCCTVWLIGPLIQGICIVALGGQNSLHFDSIKVCAVIRCLPIVLSDRRKCGTDWCYSAVSLK